MNSIVVQNLVVDFVGVHDEIVLDSEIGNLAENFAAVHSTGWVIRVDHNNRFCAVGDFALDISDIRIPFVLFIAQVMNRSATGQSC